MNLTDRELATVLAALRSWQQDLADNQNAVPFLDHFEHPITPLTVREIDELCARLNCQPRTG